jgi:hypothetical protein
VGARAGAVGPGADSTKKLGSVGASPNSLRSLRSLWSNSGDESVYEARWRAPPTEPIFFVAPEIAPTPSPHPPLSTTCFCGGKRLKWPTSAPALACSSVTST